MFDIGLQEMVLIMVLALIVFGPSKLPELGKMIGRTMREFRRASEEFRSTVETNLKLNEVDSGSSSPAPVTQSESLPGLVPLAPSSPTALAQETVPDGFEASAEAGGVATEQAVAGEPYFAQRGSRLFHRRECAWATRIAADDRLNFETIELARGQGYVACPVCEPWDPGYAL